MASEGTAALLAGIEISGGWGGACADDPDVLARLIGDFVCGDTKSAANLRKKLGASTDRERHAFIVLTAAINQSWLFDDWGTDRLPKQPLDLPPVIDRLWVTRSGRTVWWFDHTGWSGTRFSE